jgi:hypothetical protein
VKEFKPFRWFDLPVLGGGLVLLYEAAAPNTATDVAADGAAHSSDASSGACGESECPPKPGMLSGEYTSSVQALSVLC